MVKVLAGYTRTQYSANTLFLGYTCSKIPILVKYWYFIDYIQSYTKNIGSILFVLTIPWSILAIFGRKTGSNIGGVYILPSFFQHRQEIFSIFIPNITCVRLMFLQHWHFIENILYHEHFCNDKFH